MDAWAVSQWVSYYHSLGSLSNQTWQNWTTPFRWGRCRGDWFPWRCGNVLDKYLTVRTLRRGKVAYHTHHLQARQVREISTQTHTHNLRCVRKRHRSGCPNPHTSTSTHFSFISHRPAAPYRNRLSHKLKVGLPQREQPWLCIVYAAQSALICHLNTCCV